MGAVGWKSLVGGWPWFRGEGKFPLPDYSEFMTPPRLVRKPYGEWEPPLPDEDDPFGWPVNEYEEGLELAPGLRLLGRRLVRLLAGLGGGRPDPNLSELLDDNPFWPKELADRAGRLAHERYILLLPLALSHTQDEQERVRWTALGGSEQGPERPFWKSFFTAPGVEARARGGRLPGPPPPRRLRGARRRRRARRSRPPRPPRPARRPGGRRRPAGMGGEASLGRGTVAAGSQVPG